MLHIHRAGKKKLTLGQVQLQPTSKLELPTSVNFNSELVTPVVPKQCKINNLAPHNFELH